VGMALGAQLALPDRQVVDVEGDGGILFGQTENFWTISRYDVPLLVVVMNNHSYNDTRIRNLSAFPGQQQFQTGKDLTSYLGDPDVDFAKIAEAYGIKGVKVYDPKDLGPVGYLSHRPRVEASRPRRGSSRPTGSRVMWWWW